MHTDIYPANDTCYDIYYYQVDQNFQRIQTISFGHGIALAVALTTLQSTIDKKDHCGIYQLYPLQAI